MKLKNIVVALGLSVAVSAPVVANATDWLFDTVVMVAGVVGGNVTTVVALGYVGYSEGAFKSLGWSEKHWIDDVDFEKNMPAGYVNTAGIALAWVNSCQSAGGKPKGYAPVYSQKEWLNAMQLAQYRLNQTVGTGDPNSAIVMGGYGGDGSDSVGKTSYDDANKNTRKAAAVELAGSTHVGMNCVKTKQMFGRSVDYSFATYEAWVSKKDGKFHVIQEDPATGTRVDTLSVNDAIQIGKEAFDKAGLAAKKFD